MEKFPCGKRKRSCQDAKGFQSVHFPLVIFARAQLKCLKTFSKLESNFWLESCLCILAMWNTVIVEKIQMWQHFSKLGSQFALKFVDPGSCPTKYLVLGHSHDFEDTSASNCAQILIVCPISSVWILSKNTIFAFWAEIHLSCHTAGSTLLLLYFSVAWMVKYDHHRNPNINNRDHLDG